MYHFDAWQYIISHWHCMEWANIPQNIKDVLHLDSRIGMFNGMLITQVSASGVIEFVTKMNRKRGV